MLFTYDDGGRTAAGFKGKTGDCVCRAIAIASGQPYEAVYKRLADGNHGQRRSKHSDKRGRTARAGINVKRKWFRDYMIELGGVWYPCMRIGTGCRVHLADGELPMGRLVVSLSCHYTAVMDGVIRDVYDPQRTTIFVENGVQRQAERCVYGYWTFPT